MKRGEEGRGEYRKTHDHVGFTVERESFFGHMQKRFVAAEEELGERTFDAERDAVKDKAHDDNEDRTLLKCLMQLLVVFDFVLVTEDRSDTDGKAKEYRAEKEADVHKDTVRGDAVQSDEFHETVVVHDARQRMEDLTDELGNTVGEDIAHDLADQIGRAHV